MHILLDYKLSLWLKSCSTAVIIQVKATDQYFPVVLFVYAVQGGSNVCVCE